MKKPMMSRTTTATSIAHPIMVVYISRIKSGLMKLTMKPSATGMSATITAWSLPWLVRA